MIAIASGKHETFLRDLGADEFIDYTKTHPEDLAHDVDLVIDAVGGPTTDRFLRTLKRCGALFPIFPLGFSGAREAEKLGVTVSATQVRSNGAQLKEVARLLDAGTIRVKIDSEFFLADARKAHERATQGNIQGAWREAGLELVVQDAVTIRMDFACFHDFWTPVEGKEGPVAQYVTTLGRTFRAALRERVQSAYLDGEEDGLRSYAATAWVVRGKVPE